MKDVLGKGKELHLLLPLQRNVIRARICWRLIHVLLQKKCSTFFRSLRSVSIWPINAEMTPKFQMYLTLTVDILLPSYMHFLCIRNLPFSISSRQRGKIDGGYLVDRKMQQEVSGVSMGAKWASTTCFNDIGPSTTALVEFIAKIWLGLPSSQCIVSQLFITLNWQVNFKCGSIENGRKWQTTEWKVAECFLCATESLYIQFSNDHTFSKQNHHHHCPQN